MSDAAVATMDRKPMPGMMVYNKKLGMWVFLLSEVMFFTSLIGSYVILRFAHPDHWAEVGTVLNVQLTALNTFFLICSSVTMVKAFAAIQEGDQKGLQRWLLATILIGATFVASTLLWTTPSPPPHGNFPEMPQVYRGPYEYSHPDHDEDYWPQDEPPATSEAGGQTATAPIPEPVPGD